MGWQPGGTAGTIVLVDPRDSHVYQPSLEKKLTAYKCQVIAAQLALSLSVQTTTPVSSQTPLSLSCFFIHHNQTSNTRALIDNHHHFTLNHITNQQHIQDARFRLLRRPSRSHGCCSELGRQ
jgi:hypothetical protein